ncbi:polysaccharide lyase family 1 protein [Mangrovibacterium sp.]|uniref:pectate lyase family protein n=1 Tax=Mangrovibacterium sp. TaxID=1961364 RepID=UPI003566FB60
MKYAVVIILISFSCVASAQQIIAFPGAEGGGKYTSGGRSGVVLFVDNLNDHGYGSFRKAIEAEGARTIIFRVSGTIELQKPIHIKNGALTIAGQTAPGDGICLKNYGLRIDADNIIIRYIRIRPGDTVKDEQDAITGIRTKNVIIDHCSFSWSNDEVASFYDNENFTMQWCIISESFYKSTHHKGEHGYGGIWGGLNASFHHNLITDHTSRNPRLHGSRYTNNPEKEKADIRNNVIYNWGDNSIYGGEEGHYNIVNNYFKAGPATKKSIRNRILDLTQSFFDESRNPDVLGAGWFYIDGNVVVGFPAVSNNNWEEGVQGEAITENIKSRSKLSKPIIQTAIKTDKAEAAYRKIVRYVGANLYRDAVDKRIVAELKSGRETFGKSYRGGRNGIIDSQNDVGGWPELKSKTPLPDSDNDGMPDQWEEQNNSDFQTADNNAKNIDRNYTNIEVYINSLVNQKSYE